MAGLSCKELKKKATCFMVLHNIPPCSTLWHQDNMSARHFQMNLFKRNYEFQIRFCWSLFLTAINNIPAMVQIMAWHHPASMPLSEPMMVSLLTCMQAYMCHSAVTQSRILVEAWCGETSCGSRWQPRVRIDMRQFTVNTSSLRNIFGPTKLMADHQR